MPRPLRTFAFMAASALAAGALATGCASGGGAAGASASASQGSSSSRLVASDYRKPEFQTMYDVVHTLRPDWMVPRGGEKSLMHMSVGGPVVGVFIDGQSHGYPMEKLGELKPDEVSSVRFMRPSDAMAAFGPQWEWGGIVVTLERP